MSYQSSGMSLDQLNPILETAWSQSSLVQATFAQEYLYNQAIQAEQQYLLEFIAHQVDINPDLHNFQSQVIDRVDHDITILSELNDAIAYTQFFTDEELTWSLKTNKMDQALQGALDIIEDPIAFNAIVQGHFPPGFDNTPPFPVLIGNTDTAFGHSANTFLSAALVEIAISTLGEEASIVDLNQAIGMDWIDHSAISHITPINSSIFDDEQDLLESFQNQYSFHFSDALTSMGFTFIHSGYAFGGYRDEPRYEDGKWFGPEDCSSWIAKLTGSDIAFSTIDLLYTYRFQLENNVDYVDPQWLNSNEAQWMLAYFSPVEVQDPFHDIQPGQILTFRKFTSEDHSNDAGYSGHVALVLGVTEDGQVITLNYTRDMPDTEGFGISLFDYQSSAVKEVFFLEANQTSLTLNDVFSPHESDLAFWEHTELPLEVLDTQNIELASLLPPIFDEPPLQDVSFG